MPRIAIFFVIGAVMLGSAGCEQAAWKMSDESLGALAREVADHAAGGDVEYFSALTPDRAAVPDLIQQVSRSGIGTNYADHLIVETASTATLAYGLMGDETPATNFAIELSLVDGGLRVDQIVTYEKAQAGGSPGTLTDPVVSSEVAPSAIGSITVSASIASSRIRGYGLQSALIGYTNTSSEGTSVPLPLDVLVRITDSKNRLVSEGVEPPATPQALRREFLPPGSTIYSSVRFQAPEPGQYTLLGRANGVWSSAINLETTQ